MHQIASELPEYDAFFTPYYCDGFLDVIRKARLLDWTILGDKWKARSLGYFNKHGLRVDYQGQKQNYDLVVTCQDLIIPKSILGRKIILVQEGMTDPETILFNVVRTFPFIPRWIAGTATTGLSDKYDRFCVASEGYRGLFIRKGVRAGKIEVTGIPNFDNCRRFVENNFPYKHFVLVCTSDQRETFAFENRRKFIRKAVEIAGGRQLIFKLHPNENAERAAREINRYAPGSFIFTTGSAEKMVANCDVLITRYSSTVYIGLALGKEVYSDFDLEELKRLLPLQNDSAASNIANVCRELLEQKPLGEVSSQRHWKDLSDFNADPKLISKNVTSEVG